VKALALGSIAVAVAAGAFAGGYGSHGSTHTYSHTTTVVVRTVTSPPKVVIRNRTQTVYSGIQPPAGWQVIVNCFSSQCTSLPGAGPGGMTCTYDQSHPGWQACE